jgi:hypothetical protein
VVVGGDYNYVKLLKVEEVDLIADGCGLQVWYQFLVTAVTLLLKCR